MSQVNLKSKVVLEAIKSNLNHQFFVESRDHAKSLFNTLSDGKSFPLMKFELGENGDVFCELELDSSEHIGKLNFGKFRKGLAMMLLGIHQRLEADEGINPMSSNSGELMFNIPGILKSEDNVNIMVCSFRQLAPGLASVRLMYLNPEAYAQAAGVDLNDIQQNDQDPALEQHA